MADSVPQDTASGADDFNVEVDLEQAYGAAAQEAIELRAELRRLQRRLAGFEAANAELSAAPDPAALSAVWAQVQTWGFEDASPDDGVGALIAATDAEAEARAQAERALARLLDQVSHLRRIPCRECIVIPCPACTDRITEVRGGVVRRAALRDE